MTKVISINSNGGFDNFLKITSMLKRRRFSIEKLAMETIDQMSFELKLTLNSNDIDFYQAIKYLKKLEDVYYIEEIEEENYNG